MKTNWDFENCAKEALKYKTKIEFKKNSPSAYVISNRNNWMNLISQHMQPVGNKYYRCIYAYEFSDNHVYVGLTYNLNERQKNRDSHKNDAVTRYINKIGIIPIRKQLTEFVSVEVAKFLEGEFVKKYEENGWIILNSKQTGGIGGKTIYWTKENCLLAANNCKTRTEFHKKYRGAYSSSLKHKWLDEIYHTIIKSKRGGKFIHTIESCQDKAILCKTKAEFKKKYKKEFDAAYKHKWLNIICKHMINGRLKQNRLL